MTFRRTVIGGRASPATSEALEWDDVFNWLSGPVYLRGEVCDVDPRFAGHDPNSSECVSAPSGMTSKDSCRQAPEEDGE